MKYSIILTVFLSTSDTMCSLTDAHRLWEETVVCITEPGVVPKTGLVLARMTLNEAYVFTQSLPTPLSIENAYAILGLSLASTNREITVNYRKLLLKFYPDKNPDNTVFATAVSKVITAAMDVVRGA